MLVVEEGVFILQDTQDPTGHGIGTPALFDSALSTGIRLDLQKLISTLTIL